MLGISAKAEGRGQSQEQKINTGWPAIECSFMQLIRLREKTVLELIWLWEKPSG